MEGGREGRFDVKNTWFLWMLKHTIHLTHYHTAV